jgi:hypothetical protein
MNRITKFEDVIALFDEFAGLTLGAVNESTGNLNVLEVNPGRSIKVKNAEGKLSSVTFPQLKQIWEELTRKGFANVDQALYGSGSSRNRHETILANLPFIEYFKYRGKKHLLLRASDTHEQGSLKEVSQNDLKVLKKQLDQYYLINRRLLAHEHKNISDTLSNAFADLTKKYPGEINTTLVSKELIKLSELQSVLSSSLVGLDEEQIQSEPILDEPSDADKIVDLDLDQLQGSVERTGVEEEPEPEVKGVSQYDYMKDRLKIANLTPTISALFDRMSFKEIDLQPDFQRKDRIWTVAKKSKLIESILMGLPLPALYFGERDDNTDEWVVIDGLQRITTIYDYMTGRFSLTGLDKIPSINGNKFSDFDRDEVRRIREFPLNVYLIEFSRNNQEAIVEVFRRLNTLGASLSAQEIRSALNYGHSVKFLRLLAESSEFKIATHNKVQPLRQKDMELCLGVIGYILFGYKSFNYDKYDSFLVKTMLTLNKHDIELRHNESDILEYQDAELMNESSGLYLDVFIRFKKALNLAHEVFGELAFRKKSDQINRQPINKSLFEVIVSCFAMLNDDQHEALLNANASGSALAYSLLEAIEDDDERLATWVSESYSDQNRGFEYSISQSTGKKVTVLYRFDAFIQLLRETTTIELTVIPLMDSYIEKGDSD